MKNPTLTEINKMEYLLNVASDATRLKIMFSLIDDSKCTCDENNCCCGHRLKRTCQVEKCVNDIVNSVNLSQSLISHQLKVLKDAKLVSIRKEGTKVYYRLSDGHIKELLKVVFEHISDVE